MDQKCWEAVENKKKARKKMVQTNTEQAKIDYTEKRNIAKQECRNKKRQFLTKQIEEIEENYKNNASKTFYCSVNRFKKGTTHKTQFC